MGVAEYVFFCGRCNEPFATRNPDRWLKTITKLDEDGTTRRYCDCGHLLATMTPLKVSA